MRCKATCPPSKTRRSFTTCVHQVATSISTLTPLCCYTTVYVSAFTAGLWTAFKVLRYASKSNVTYAVTKDLIKAPVHRHETLRHIPLTHSQLNLSTEPGLDWWNCCTLSGVRSMSCSLSQLNILCSNLVKPYYTDNDNSGVIHRSHVTATLRVLQRTRFYWRGAIHTSKRSVLYQE